MNDSSRAKQKQKQRRKTYSKPELKNHGRVKDLTTGASGMMQEMMGAGAMSFP